MMSTSDWFIPMDYSGAKTGVDLPEGADAVMTQIIPEVVVPVEPNVEIIPSAVLGLSPPDHQQVLDLSINKERQQDEIIPLEDNAASSAEVVVVAAADVGLKRIDPEQWEQEERDLRTELTQLSKELYGDLAVATRIVMLGKDVEILKTKKSDRLEHFANVKAEMVAACRTLGTECPPWASESESSIVPLPSEEDLELYRQETSQLTQNVTLLKDRMCELSKEVESLMTVLDQENFDGYQHLFEFIGTSFSKEDLSAGLNLKILNEMIALRDKYQEEVQERKTRLVGIKQKREELIAIWNNDIFIKDRDERFKTPRYKNGRLLTEDEFSTEMLKSVTAELDQKHDAELRFWKTVKQLNYEFIGKVSTFMKLSEERSSNRDVFINLGFELVEMEWKWPEEWSELKGPFTVGGLLMSSLINDTLNVFYSKEDVNGKKRPLQQEKDDQELGNLKRRCIEVSRVEPLMEDRNPVSHPETSKEDDVLKDKASQPETVKDENRVLKRTYRFRNSMGLSLRLYDDIDVFRRANDMNVLNSSGLNQCSLHFDANGIHNETVRYDSQAALYHHFSRHHDTKKRLTCQICANAIFATQALLKEHIREKHSAVQEPNPSVEDFLNILLDS